MKQEYDPGPSEVCTTEREVKLRDAKVLRPGTRKPREGPLTLSWALQGIYQCIQRGSCLN